MSPASDASDPRRLVERPPACVLRVRLDGLLLACNDAALGLFGIGERRDVLNTNLTDRIAMAQHAHWREFMTRCWAEGAGSVECDLVTRSSEARPVLIDGIALTDHPDGVESLLLHLRDEPTPERRQLVEALEVPAADRQPREAQFVELHKKLEQSQLLSLQKEREYGRDVAMLKSALAAARAAKATALAEKQELEPLKLRLQAVTAEQVRLQTLVAEYEVDRTRIAAEHQAAVATLEQSLAHALAEQRRLIARAEDQTREHDRMRAEHQQAVVGLEASKDAALADLGSQLARTLAEQGSLAERVEMAERELDVLRAEHHQALADLEAATGVVTELRRQLSAASVEQGRLAARVQEHDRERDNLVAEHRRVLADVATRNREMAESRAEQVRLLALVAEYEIDRKRAAADHQAEVDTLEQSLAQSRAEQSRMGARVDEQTRLLDVLRAEHQHAHERLIAEHRRALADMETAKGAELAELHSQLSQAFADQRRLAADANRQQQELNRLRAEHGAALTNVENMNRGVLAELRSQLADTATAHTRILAERAAEHGRERDRMIAEHGVVIADVQASNEAAAAELRAQLSAAAAEHHRLTALLEDGDRERERIVAEHQRAIAELQASQRETVAECERVLTEIKQALLVRDASRRLENDRSLVDGIDEGPVTEADGERFASLQRGLTVAFSRMHAVIQGEAAPKEDRLEEADLVHEPFDDADDAFVHQLLERIGATPRPVKLPDPKPAAPAQAVSGTQALTAGDKPVDAVFDAQDAAFARGLMDTHRAPGEVDQADAASPQALPQSQPTLPEDS